MIILSKRGVEVVSLQLTEGRNQRKGRKGRKETYFPFLVVANRGKKKLTEPDAVRGLKKEGE